MSSSTSSNPIIMNLNVGDQLTSISCGHIVVELIKFIAYQRLQIPYKYHWLKQIVNRRKTCETNDRKESLQSERHFRTASTALENLDCISKSLLQEITGATLPEEVCIALGATPVTCKEVYRLLLPTTFHYQQCHSEHIASDQKIQQKVFRTLVTSDTLSEIFYSPLPPTNMYIFIKKKVISNQDILLNSDNFVLSSGCRIPRSSKIVVLDFDTQDKDKISCCSKFQVFNDVISEKLVKLQIQKNNDQNKRNENFNEIESSDDKKWYQSLYVMKGFKDCIVNGTSVTNSWFETCL